MVVNPSKANYCRRIDGSLYSDSKTLLLLPPPSLPHFLTTSCPPLNLLPCLQRLTALSLNHFLNLLFLHICLPPPGSLPPASLPPASLPPASPSSLSSLEANLAKWAAMLCLDNCN